MTSQDHFDRVKNIILLLTLLGLKYSPFFCLLRHGIRILYMLVVTVGRQPRTDQPGWKLSDTTSDLKSITIYLLVVTVTRHLYIPLQRRLMHKGCLEFLKLYPLVVASLISWDPRAAAAIAELNAPWPRRDQFEAQQAAFGDNAQPRDFMQKRSRSLGHWVETPN